MQKRIILAFDPGSGYLDTNGKRHNSATGWALYDPNTDELLDAGEFRTFGKQTTWQRIRELARLVGTKMQQLTAIYGPLEVRIEVFVMKGVAAEVLYRLTGAYIAMIPADAHFMEIHNITLKKDLTGDGKADKNAIYDGLIRRFDNNKKSLDILQKLKQDKGEDALDAVAIAVCREVHK
jgi:Holliday junction resolvasome RuvABC endonuclease subunit